MHTTYLTLRHRDNFPSAVPSKDVLRGLGKVVLHTFSCLKLFGDNPKSKIILAFCRGIQKIED